MLRFITMDYFTEAGMLTLLGFLVTTAIVTPFLVVYILTGAL